jgi:hypothetical protein
MPFNLADAVVFFKGDDSQLNKDLADAEKKTGSAVGNMAKLFGGALVGAATVAAGAIVGIGTEAFNVASDIDAATDQIGASLGLNSEKAKAFGQTITDIYANNFGDSIADVGTAVENVAKQLRLTADDPALKTMTENAFRMRDVFGVDVADSIDAVKTLTEQFGITSEQAFDMLATGYQRGLDRSGDFLDTIGEYSVQFAEGGASAVEFFSALDTGLQGGMLGTDKAADAFKEFRVRIQDGSTLTAESLAMIGLSAEAITTGLASGAITAADAWDMVQKGLGSATDSSVQFQAGVGLIGTQFEDLGAKTILAMDLTEDWAEGGLNAISGMDSKYSNLGSVFEGMWRQFQVGIAPAGEAMLAFVNENLPMLQGAVSTASGIVVTMIGNIPLAITAMRVAWDEDWAGMRTTITTFVNEVPVALQGMWTEIDLLFQREGDETGEGWENFWEGLSTFFSGWVLVVIDSWTEAIRSIRSLWEAGAALLSGDWEGFWDGMYNYMDSIANQILNFIEFWFGAELRNSMAGAMQGMWDGAKEKLAEMLQWWQNAWVPFRNMLPFSEPVNPNSPFAGLGDSGAAVIDNFQKGMEGRLSQLAGVGNTAPSTNYAINVNMGNGGYENGFATGEGILDAMRFRGV